MEKTTVYTPTEVKMSIRASAKRQGASEAYAIREALEAYFAAEPRPLPNLFGSVASDGTVTSENYEDWLAENWKPEW